MAAWEEALGDDEQASPPEPGDLVDWSGQQADVKDGRWLVPVPAMTRTGPGPLTVAVPPAPGHPPTSVLVYESVPYDQFDFAQAEPPPNSWPVGWEPLPDLAAAAGLEGFEQVTAAGPEDLEDGRLRLTVPASLEVALQVTTQGQGRMRILVDGEPPERLFASDGWWSSWTDQEVVSLVPLFHTRRAESELTVVVEDHESFTVEVLTH